MDRPVRDIEGMRSFVRRTREERKSRLDARLAEARRDFQRILEMIIRDYRPARVYQWGSLLEGGHFQEISDIDVALSGVTDAATFFELCGRAAEMTSLPLHIVQFEAISPVYAEEIRRSGRLVYERPV